MELMTTQQIKNLVGRMVKNKRAARAARALKQFRAFSSKQQLEITIFAHTPSICFIQNTVQYYCTSPTDYRRQTSWDNHKKENSHNCTNVYFQNVFCKETLINMWLYIMRK